MFILLICTPQISSNPTRELPVQHPMMAQSSAPSNSSTQWVLIFNGNPISSRPSDYRCIHQVSKENQHFGYPRERNTEILMDKNQAFLKKKSGSGVRCVFQCTQQWHPALGTPQRQFPPRNNLCHLFCLRWPQCCAIIFRHLLAKDLSPGVHPTTNSCSPRIQKGTPGIIEPRIFVKRLFHQSHIRKSTCTLLPFKLEDAMVHGPVQGLRHSARTSPQTSSNIYWSWKRRQGVFHLQPKPQQSCSGQVSGVRIPYSNFGEPHRSCSKLVSLVVKVSERTANGFLFLK